MDTKRNFLFLLLFCATSLFAQKSNEGLKATFKPYYTLQIQGGLSHTLGEGSFSDLISPAVAANVGYKFTPVFGLRAGVSGLRGKGVWVNPKTDYKFNFLQGNVDALFDLSSLFYKYNPDRFFNAYGFIGGGVNFASGNDEANALYKKGYILENLWDGSKTFLVGRFGLGTNLRLSQNIFFNVEVNSNVLSDKFNSKKAGNPDWHFNALGGLTFKFGNSGKKVVEEPQYVEPVPVPEPVVKEEEPKPIPVVIEDKEEVKEAITENIFFTINSSKIDDSEMSKIEALVKYLNQYPEAKIDLVGYADKGTGTSAINERISNHRALSVKNELINRGINSDRISTDYKGSTVQPFAENDMNRVTICIAE